MNKKLRLEVQLITDEAKKDKAIRLIKKGLKLLEKSIEVNIAGGDN